MYVKHLHCTANTTRVYHTLVVAQDYLSFRVSTEISSRGFWKIRRYTRNIISDFWKHLGRLTAPLLPCHWNVTKNTRMQESGQIVAWMMNSPNDCDKLLASLWCPQNGEYHIQEWLNRHAFRLPLSSVASKVGHETKQVHSSDTGRPLTPSLRPPGWSQQASSVHCRSWNQFFLQYQCAPTTIKRHPD